MSHPSPRTRPLHGTRLRWALLGLVVAAAAGTPFAFAQGSGRTSVVAGVRTPVVGAVLTATTLATNVATYGLDVFNDSQPRRRRAVLVPGHHRREPQPVPARDQPPHRHRVPVRLPRRARRLLPGRQQPRQAVPGGQALRHQRDRRRHRAERRSGRRPPRPRHHRLRGRGVERPGRPAGAAGAAGRHGRARPAGRPGRQRPSRHAAGRRGVTPPNATYGNRRVVDLPNESLNSTSPPSPPTATTCCGGQSIVLDPGTYIIQTTMRAFDIAGEGPDPSLQYGVAGVFLDGQLQSTLWTPDIPFLGDGNIAALASDTTVVGVSIRRQRHRDDPWRGPSERVRLGRLDRRGRSHRHHHRSQHGLIACVRGHLPRA